MSTLLLKLAAPLQAWGSASKFNRRMTNREPTKSGVLGLIAAALGRRRSDSIDDLQNLKYGVRIDQTGILIKDFHTAKYWYDNNTFDSKRSFISNRYYLSDALFIVGLEGGDRLLQEIDSAIKNPYFPLYLGRRSCPPVGQLSLGIREGKSLLEALKEEPWQAGEWYKKQAPPELSLEIVFDAGSQDAGAYTLRDVPVSFDQTHRKYAFRSVLNDINAVNFTNSASIYAKYTEKPTAHDPMPSLDSVKEGGE